MYRAASGGGQQQQVPSPEVVSARPQKPQNRGGGIPDRGMAMDDQSFGHSERGKTSIEEKRERERVERV